MKITKRLFSFVTALAVSVSCISTAVFADEATGQSSTAKFPDVSETEVYTDAVGTLSLMGIVNGYEDGTFRPDNNVTRAEFTAMLMRVLKLGDVGSKSAAELPFSDIDDNDSDINWSIPNINTAYGRGAINGYEDGTFRPKDNVAYEEAIKMIVCTLGYGDNVDVSGNPWYANYVSIANQIGILKSASKIGAVETPATRACIAQLLYDALDVKLVENGEKTKNTILNSYLGYRKCSGVIASNKQTSLTSPDVNLRDDEILIYGHEDDSVDYETATYRTADTTLMDKLGAEVEYYYKDNGAAIRELAFCVVKSDDSFVLNAKNVEASESDSTQIRYYENLDDDKSKTIGLEPDNVVIYNGKLYGSNASNSRFNTSMIPELGELRFIDSDSNGRYDVVEISAYDVYYVSSKVASTYAINDNVLHASGTNIILNTSADDGLSIVNKSGSEVTFSSIATGNIICIAESNAANGGEQIKKAIVLTDKVTGTVTGTGSDNVTISGTKYYFSDLAPWVKDDTVAAPKMQDTGTFCLDINGDIVAFNKNATTDNIVYGYVIGYGSNNDDPFESNVEIRVRTASNSGARIWTYKNTTVDGQTVSDGYTVVSKLKEAARSADIATDKTNGIQQVIKYTTKTVDGKTVFDKIITANGVSKGKEVVSDELTKFTSVDATENFVYNSSTNKLTGEDSKLTIGLSGAIVFTVPDDNERNDVDKFSKKSVSDVFKNGISYNIEVYDVTASNTAKVVVALAQDNTQAVNSASPVYVLNEISEENNSDEGTAMTLFKGFKASPNSSGAEFSEWMSSDSSSVTDDMQSGDIYRAGTDSDGYATVDSGDIIYRYGSSIKYGVTKETSGLSASALASLELEDAEFATIIGSVTVNDQDADSIAVLPAEKTQQDAEYEITSDEITFDISDFSSAMTIIYDTTSNNGKLTLLRESDTESVVRGLTPIQNGNPSKVMIYMSEGRIRLLCVLPQD